MIKHAHALKGCPDKTYYLKPDGLSIDRINNYSSYRRWDCRWSTQEEQINNSRVKGGCKFTQIQKAEMRNLYHAKMYSQKKIAKLYGVSFSHISQILRGRLRRVK